MSEEINESEELAETLRQDHQGEHTFIYPTHTHTHIHIFSLGTHLATHILWLIGLCVGSKPPQA